MFSQLFNCVDFWEKSMDCSSGFFSILAQKWNSTTSGFSKPLKAAEHEFIIYFGVRAVLVRISNNVASTLRGLLRWRFWGLILENWPILSVLKLLNNLLKILQIGPKK